MPISYKETFATILMVTICLSVSLVMTPVMAAGLQSHRAVYDVQSLPSNGEGQLGRGQLNITWQQTCDGYVLDHEMDFALTAATGDVLETRMTYRYQESLDGKRYDFRARQFINDRISEESEGAAIIGSQGKGIVRFSVPERKNQVLAEGVLFPSSFTFDLINTLKAGERFYTGRIFDGTSLKSHYRVSGLQLADKYMPALAEEVAGFDLLRGVQGWPLKVSWFDLSGDQRIDSRPDFTVEMDLYENGISRFMTYEYPGLKIRSSLREIEAIDSPQC